MKRLNMQTISVSEIQRNLHKLDGYDIIEVVDKKRNQIKGYFLDTSYKSLIENLVDIKDKKKNNLLNIIGVIDDGSDVNRDSLRDERLSQYE